jgi:hypothetical protein
MIPILDLLAQPHSTMPYINKFEGKANPIRDPEVLQELMLPDN